MNRKDFQRSRHIPKGMDTCLLLNSNCATCDNLPNNFCEKETPCTDGCGLIDLRLSFRTTKLKPSVSSTKPNVPPSPPSGDKQNVTNIITSISCGKHNPDGVGFKIIFDDNKPQSQFGEFPWMVSILHEIILEGGNKKWIDICGASIIHPEVILTSAQCVATMQNQRLKIRAGEWDTLLDLEIYPHQERDVKDFIIHPDYHKRGSFNDVALLILDSPLEINYNVKTVCLPSQNEVLENLTCLATGWGKDSFGEDGKYQEILKKVQLPIVQRDACQEQLRTSRLGKYFTLDESLICAGGELGKDMCTGDAGSPLVCPIPGESEKYQQIGLVSWGIGCGEKLPAAYGNVAHFRNWIDSEMLKLSFDASTYTYVK